MADVQRAELEALQSELATVRRELADLRATYAEARAGANMSMRSRTLCPACRCTKILHSREVLDMGDNDTRVPMSLAKPSWWRSRKVGQFSVYICTACGLTEWYTNTSDLDPGEVDHFEILEGAAPVQGPFR